MTEAVQQNGAIVVVHGQDSKADTVSETLSSIAKNTESSPNYSDEQSVIEASVETENPFDHLNAVFPKSHGPCGPCPRKFQLAHVLS